MSEILQRGKPYRLGDPLNRQEEERFGVRREQNKLLSFSEGKSGEVMAVWTGDKRPPKKGEWYLSGAIICACRAPADLTSDYHIARLVKVATETVTRIIG